MKEGTLSLADLSRAGLTPDWQTAYVGWRGFSSKRWYDWQLPATEVQQFAADCLTGDADADYPLVRILDAEPSDKGLLQEEDALRYLAARSGVDAVTARRKWRYAAAREVPLTQPPLAPDEIDDPYADAIYNWYSRVADFWNDWNGAIPEYSIPALDFDGFPSGFIARFRSWLAEEKAALGAR